VTDEAGNLNPFRNDERIAEEGYAAETSIHKHVILKEMKTNISIPTTPFGMCANPWPGRLDGDGYPVKATAAKHGIEGYTSYAVPMSVSIVKTSCGMHLADLFSQYVQQFFLDDFWDNRILRFGDGALGNYKAVGVRLRHKVQFVDVETASLPDVIPFCNDSRIKEEGNALEAAVHVSEPRDVSSVGVRLECDTNTQAVDLLPIIGRVFQEWFLRDGP
jgi:hypothetical protein